MPCFAVHSQLLFVLLTTYVNMSFFIFIAGQHSFRILEMNITESTVEEVEDAFEKLKVSTSLILHWVVAVCIIACIVMNNVEAISRILPATVVVTVLIFAFFINIIGAVLLLIYNASANQDKLALQNSGFLSLCAALGSLLLAVFFAMMPPKNLMFIETNEALHVGRRPTIEKVKGPEESYVNLLELMKDGFRKDICMFAMTSTIHLNSILSHYLDPLFATAYMGIIDMLLVLVCWRKAKFLVKSSRE